MDLTLKPSTCKCRIGKGAASGREDDGSSTVEKPREKAGAGTHHQDRLFATLTTQWQAEMLIQQT
ncbi:MAG: hypothetical protein J0L58_13725 [Burkholderiales bacterium]|nr:hypothetical protein [Burkholderiales bacterium]